MEVAGVVKDGRIELPDTVRLAEGTRVRVIVESGAERDAARSVADPYDREAVSEESVLADLAWATGTRFQP